ncbi:hypothetical protein GS982_20035 [Rhodococcus hoagii]|nr:hypothetical protein [Prescottella equi]NKZ84493.1 hypothetical protein [Prescottella equi]
MSCWALCVGGPLDGRELDFDSCTPPPEVHTYAAPLPPVHVRAGDTPPTHTPPPTVTYRLHQRTYDGHHRGWVYLPEGTAP